MAEHGLPEILATHTPALFDEAVRQATKRLQAGEVVALPTETVYGLAANAWDAKAVARIFTAKGRPIANPVIVHVASMEMARSCVEEWPPLASTLAAAFWPGPLTLVLRRSAAIPDVVTAHGDTVGVRWPAHPFIQAVIMACGFPLAAPSANRSNQLSPTSAQQVLRSLGRNVGLIVDGGQSHVGIESTVLDLTTVPPAILRPGMIRLPSLTATVNQVRPSASNRDADHPLRSPGQLPLHYAPKAALCICAWTDEADLLNQLQGRGIDLKTCHVVAHSHIPSGDSLGGVSVIPHDAEAYARALYGELDRCDLEGATTIVVERVPDGVEWEAIADRLQRASAPRRR